MSRAAIRDAEGATVLRDRCEVALEDEDSGMAAYLVVEPSACAVSFGGTRIDPAVTHDMVRELGECMSMKLAGHGAGVGGGKAGVRAAPDDPRLPQFLARFADACREVLSSAMILGKDMGAQQWMIDTIYDALGHGQLSVARERLGRGELPSRLADLQGYIPNMTGQGVFWAIDEALNGAVRDARVLIQGFGVVGSGVARHLDKAGARIVGVSDRAKAVVAPDGLDLELLLAAKCDRGLIDPCVVRDGCQVIARDALLGEVADVLVLAAGSYLVDGPLAETIRAPLIVEGANVALTEAARKRLHERGTLIVPDVIANSSSAALVGHQIAARNMIAPGPLWERIEASIRGNTHATLRASSQLDLDSRSAFRTVVLGKLQP